VRRYRLLWSVKDRFASWIGLAATISAVFLAPPLTGEADPPELPERGSTSRKDAGPPGVEDDPPEAGSRGVPRPGVLRPGVMFPPPPPLPGVPYVARVAEPLPPVDDLPVDTDSVCLMLGGP
jgi:hypothetical protein